jgi:hypothetical protein
MAILVAAITSATAVYIHQRRVPYGTTHLQVLTNNDSRTNGPEATLPDLFEGAVTHRPSWEDPVAVLLSVGGFVVGFGIIGAGDARLERSLCLRRRKIARCSSSGTNGPSQRLTRATESRDRS